MKPTETATFERKRTANLESLIGSLKVRKMSENPSKQKMHSLYVEVSGSDCSRSTPPLSSSSPSVSPSSISPESPVQSNVSSSLSSISSSSIVTASNSSSQKSRSMLPKFRWMMESSPQENSFKEDDEYSIKNEKIKKIKSPKKSDSKQNEDPSRQIKFYDDYVDFRGDILRRPPNSKSCRILWEFLFLLLQDPAYSAVIKWEDDSKMIFRIVQAEKLAALWGLQKNRLGMTYEKLSRGMRYYYPNNIIAREPGRRLLYRFMRHPDEIKKFVKKNGTYMLKKAKSNGKDDKNDLNPEDSGVDEPCRFKNEELDEEFLDEEMEQEEEEVKDEPEEQENKPILDKNDNNNQSNLKNSPLGQNPVQFYSDLYQYMYQAQMNAAAQMGLPIHAYLMRGQEQNLNEPMMKQLVSLLAQQQNFNMNKFKNGASDSSSSYSSSSSTYSLESESNPLNLSINLKKKKQSIKHE